MEKKLSRKLGVQGQSAIECSLNSHPLLRIMYIMLN